MALGAEAVIDELDVLEAALHKATTRQHVSAAPQRRLPGGNMAIEPLSARSRASQPYSPSSPTADGLEAAELVYGLQLKAWIDMQVDTRINMIQNVIESKLAAVDQDCVAALDGTNTLSAELEVVKGAQARLVSVAQDMSDELTHLKEKVGKEAIIVDRVTRLLEETRQSMLTKEQGQMLVEYVTSHENDLSEVKQGLLDCQNAISDLKAAQIEASPPTEVSELIQQLEQSQSVWHADLRAEVSEELSALKTAMKSSKATLVDASFKETRLEIDLAERRRQRQIEDLRKQLDGEFDALQRDIKDLRHSSAETIDQNRSIKEQLLEIRESSQELNSAAKRQLQDLHSEVQDAFKNEAEAVASLDRNLWRTARQLGTRIDELVQNHNECLDSMSERCSVGIGKLVCSPPAASISNTVMSPRSDLIRQASSPSATLLPSRQLRQAI